MAGSFQESFAIVPAQVRLSWILILALIAAILVAALAFAIRAGIGSQLGELWRGNLGPDWKLLLIPILVIIGPLLGIGLLGRSLWGSQHARFVVEPAGLRVHGDLYSRMIPFGALQLDSARIIDLRTEASLTPVLRMMGTALPGYRAGWFRLRNKARALLFVTDPERVVYIPVAQGTGSAYVLLLSAQHPDRLLERLREAGAAK